MKYLISIVSMVSASLLISSCGPDSIPKETANTASILGKANHSLLNKGTPDIAGITAYMTIDQVKENAKKKGYEPSKNVKNRRNLRPIQFGPSFEQMVERAKGVAIPQADHKTIHILVFSKDGTQERLFIFFTPFEKRPLVTRIQYVSKAENMNEQIFLARAKEKYGESNYDSITRNTTWSYDEGNNKTTTITLRPQGLELKIKDPNANLSQLVRDHINAEIENKTADTTF